LRGLWSGHEKSALPALVGMPFFYPGQAMFGIFVLSYLLFLPVAGFIRTACNGSY